MNIDIYTLIFAALAVFLFFKLRSVLGTKTGDEKPFNNFPLNKSAETPIQPVQDAAKTPFKWQGFAEEGSPRATVFDNIAKVDANFNPQDFLNGSKNAYEMFIQAFARGDRAMLQPHLSNEVFASFNEVITQREKAQERVDLRFVSLDKSEIRDVRQNGNEAEIDMFFLAQVVNATYDKDGKVIEGDATKVTELRDLWTFAKDLSSKNPNWTLVSTDDVD